MDFEIEETSIKLKPNKNVCPNDLQKIPTIDAEDSSYPNFFHNFMQKNVPCIVKNVAKNWEATSKWVTNGKPNLEYLSGKYNHTKVAVYNCSERYFNSQKCTESTFKEYLELWNKQPVEDSLYYLKDWHLKLQCKDDNFYEVPVYFASDWLNEYFIDCSKDDYRFVYLGQKGTWTPLHVDVFNSYSWSVNVCGQKKWIFFPPGEEIFLKDQFNNLPYDIEDISHSRKCFEIIQNPGEAIFVPSSWYHQVWNLEDTISVNHNWVNGCNITTMWDSLKRNLELTKKEIDDCKEMDNFEEHCQTMLKALFGIHYEQFYELLSFIANNRLDMVNNETKRTLFHGHRIGINHVMFDLFQLHEVIKDFLACDDVSRTDYYFNGQSLLNEIAQSLKNRNLYS